MRASGRTPAFCPLRLQQNRARLFSDSGVAIMSE
jgi:hypothetical protein